MGIVYRATQLALDRRVALKVIAAGLAEDVSFRERFMRESRTAAALDHPNIVPVYHAGEEDGLLFIAMRYVEGKDLLALIRAEGRLEPGRAARIIAQVGGALDAAHAHGLVHRDVKPGNILLTRNEDQDHAYLSDFGLTKHSTSIGGITETGQWVGTLDFVAPEQIKGESADARADIYSLGGVLYQALTGSVPFPKESDAAKLYAHLASDPMPCSEAVEGLPAAFDRVVLRALSKEPGDRFLSAGDLGRAACAAASNQPTEGPERAMARGAAAPGGPGGAPTPLPSVPVTQLRGDAWTLGGSRPDSNPPAPTAPPGGPPSQPWTPDRRRRRLVVGGAIAVVIALAAGAVALLSGSGGGAGTPKAKMIAVGGAPQDVVADSAGAWVAIPSPGAVVRIDSKAGRVVSRTPIPYGPLIVASDGSGAWVATSLGHKLTHLVPGGGRPMPATATVAGAVYDLTLASGHVWVAQETGAGPLTRKTSVVSMIDEATGQVVGPDVPVGRGPTSVADGQGFVWAANAASGTVVRIDPHSGRAVGSPIKGGASASAIAAGPEGVWVVDSDSG
ncbi:MAG: hypothetical protein QOJ07_1049, partial [Thermoleophilaceae bacterium]|nr:hypothetical protein [Thermoleophilaceae bacterium]